MKCLIYGVISALLAWFDLYVKKFVEENVSSKEEESVCEGRVVIRHVHNQGFALNVAEEKKVLVKVLSIISLGSIVGYVTYIWEKSSCIGEKLAASLVLAGGISNVYERFKKGYVVDYIAFKTKWKKFNRVTFNLGDFFIFSGGFILLIKMIIKESCR